MFPADARGRLDIRRGTKEAGPVEVECRRDDETRSVGTCAVAGGQPLSRCDSEPDGGRIALAGAHAASGTYRKAYRCFRLADACGWSTQTHT